MARVLVTGGAGYIGAHAVRDLSRAGHECVVLDNLVYGHPEIVQEVLGVELVVGDTQDRALLDRLLGGRTFDAVMHFAAYAYVGESVTDPGRYYRNNVGGTLSLLEAMRDHDVSALVFSSTCATYGVPEHIPITEDHPQRPINPYGFTKLVVEHMLRDFDRAHGLRSVALRYFNAAGADAAGDLGEWHEPETHLIPLALDVALGRRDHLAIFGDDYDTRDGTCVRDYIHVTDLAHAHTAALGHLLEGGESDQFNLGNGLGFTVREVVDTVRAVTDRAVPVVHEARRPGDPPTLVGSAEKISTRLGWSPRHPDLATIVASAWRWHRARFG